MESVLEYESEGSGRVIVSPKKKHEENYKKADIYQISSKLEAFIQGKRAFIFHKLFPFVLLYIRIIQHYPSGFKFSQIHLKNILKFLLSFFVIRGYNS